MLEVTFRIQRDRSLSRVSASFPRSRLIVWCNFRTDVVEVQSPDRAERESVKKALLRRLTLAEGSEQLAAGSTLVLRCAARPASSVTRAVEDQGGICLPPTVIEGGWDTFRIVLPQDRRLPRLVARLAEMGTVKIVRKTWMRGAHVEHQFMLPAGELLGALTARQSEAILLALHAGYYQVPRGRTMQEVAARLGRPRTTLEEHVRKGEAKVLSALSPYLALRLHEGPGRGRPRKVPGNGFAPRARTWHAGSIDPEATAIAPGADSREPP